MVDYGYLTEKEIESLGLVNKCLDNIDQEHSAKVIITFDPNYPKRQMVSCPTCGYTVSFTPGR